MSYEDIIRAWKDEDYRMSLSEEELAQLPENPAGLIELTDTELELIGGGYLGDDDNGVDTSPCSTSLACPNSCGDKNCGKKKVDDDELSESLWLL